MNKGTRENRRPENAQLRKDIDVFIDKCNLFLKNNLQELDIYDYKFNCSLAVEELGLEKELIYQLIEDYIIQILKSKVTFLKDIKELKQAKLENKVLNYANIRNLAHKNLGVARNLRIKDSQKLLTILLKDDNLDYMELCAEALEASAVKLIPLCTYETLNLIKVKNSL